VTDTQTRPLPPRDPATFSRAEQITHSGADWAAWTRELSEAEAASLLHAWSLWRRPAQVAPPGDWRVWMLRAGRGYGKTRAGAEETRGRVESGRARAVAIVGPTVGDVRDVMIEGPSGILSVSPDGERPAYEPSKRKLTWPNGALGHTYSAEDPDRLRGPEHDWAWADEPASWKRPEAWDNLMLGLRVGADPRAMVTMTPKPIPWIRALAEHRRTASTGGSTYENAANLAGPFLEDILDRYEGTRLGRQELHAHFLDDVEGALWTMELLDVGRLSGWLPSGEDVVVVGVDPPGETAECGIVVAAGPRRKTNDAHAHVLDDLSLSGPPEVWGAQVVTAWRRWGARKVLVEANQGGDMCRAVIHNVDASCPVEKIRAAQSKLARAEPVSVLYERGRVHHVGFFPDLESQMVTWVPGEKSPDRLDALVHAVSDLLPARPLAPASFENIAGRRLVAQ
jgi:phage terminase large subunit-like protein